MGKIQPAMSEQKTMLQACQASKALQKTFEDDYASLVNFTAECIQVLIFLFADDSCCLPDPAFAALNFRN